MSTRQSFLDQFEAPDWMQGYDDPVVRVPGSTGRTKKMHEPDPTATEPRPACAHYGSQDREWIVKERAALVPHWELCDECQGDAEFNGGTDE